MFTRFLSRKSKLSPMPPTDTTQSNSDNSSGVVLDLKTALNEVNNFKKNMRETILKHTDFWTSLNNKILKNAKEGQLSAAIDIANLQGVRELWKDLPNVKVITIRNAVSDILEENKYKTVNSDNDDSIIYVYW